MSLYVPILFLNTQVHLYTRNIGLLDRITERTQPYPLNKSLKARYMHTDGILHLDQVFERLITSIFKFVLKQIFPVFLPSFSSVGPCPPRSALDSSLCLRVLDAPASLRNRLGAWRVAE